MSSGSVTDCDTSVTSADIPSTINNVTIKTIGSKAFDGCVNITDITLPDTVTTINSYAFYNCTGMTSINIPDSVTSIGAYAFSYCKSLPSIEIPSSVTSIGSNTFEYCTKLADVVLPDNLTELSASMFSHCSSLKTIELPSSLTSITGDAFYFSGLKNIEIPEGVTTINSGAFEYSSLKTIKLPSTLKTISAFAFYCCTYLETIEIPDGTTSIGQNAFKNCQCLETVVIPKSVTSIYYKDSKFNLYWPPFDLCYALKKVYCYRNSAADNSALYYTGAEMVYLDNLEISPAAFTVAGVFGGRNVTFSSETEDVKIYYSTTTSNITTYDTCVSNGDTVLFESFYGTVYARAYIGGLWSNVSKLILKIPTVNAPTINVSGNKASVKSSTPSAYIYYTTDGTIPTTSNGKNLGINGGTITVNDDDIIKAIAVRSCFTNSDVTTYTMPNAFDGTVYPAAFTVVGTFGGRNVTFKSNTGKAKIYYSQTTSSLTTEDTCVSNGETVLFDNFYRTIYARAYYNGKWSNVSRLILKIPTINTPEITYSEGKVTIRTTTPNCYIYYTTDGTTPSVTNGKKLCSNSYGQVIVSSGTTIKAIAVRSCFTNSMVVSYTAS